MDSFLPDLMMQAIEHALENLEDMEEAKGLGGVMYMEEVKGRRGLSVEWQVYTEPEVLSQFRVAMRELVRDDMVGLLMGVRNVLPGQETYKDVSLALMANNEEMNAHNVARHLSDAVRRNKDHMEGDRVALVSGLLMDKTYVHGKRVNGGETKFFKHDADWDRAPGIVAMRYWMDMPV